MGVVSSIRTAAALAMRHSMPAHSRRTNSSEFAQMLKSRLDERQISVSAHAADRMARRGLIVNENTVNQLHTAFDLAERKGSREALFLLDEMAVIASVPDRTIKTALGRNDMGGSVFTHIDTTVVLSSERISNTDNNTQLNQSPESFGRAPARDATILPGGLLS